MLAIRSQPKSMSFISQKKDTLVFLWDTIYNRRFPKYYVHFAMLEADLFA
jgi:hypothetical protein